MCGLMSSTLLKKIWTDYDKIVHSHWRPYRLSFVSFPYFTPNFHNHNALSIKWQSINWQQYNGNGFVVTSQWRFYALRVLLVNIIIIFMFIITVRVNNVYRWKQCSRREHHQQRAESAEYSSTRWPSADLHSASDPTHKYQVSVPARPDQRVSWELRWRMADNAACRPAEYVSCVQTYVSAQKRHAQQYCQTVHI